MTTKIISFEVKPSSGIAGYWIAVGNQRVRLTNGKGSIRLQTGRKHILVWWMAGNQSASIKITGQDAGKNTVVEVKESKVPLGEHEGGGTRRFELT